MTILATTTASDKRDPYLCGVAGVRKGAAYRRDSIGGAHRSWMALDKWRAAQRQRRGRVWSEVDRTYYADMRAQTWGVVEVGDARVALPLWMRETIEREDGEAIECVRNLRARTMLAIVWASLEAGTGGVLLTHEHWAEVLC